MPEQRQYIRKKKSLVVSYRVVNQFMGSGGRTKDICAGGICLPSFQRLEPHAILELKIFLLDDDKPIMATGEVVWIKKRDDLKLPFEVGIKFIKIDQSARDKILELTSKEGQTEVKWID